MVGEHRGLWAKQKMQSRQMNIYMTVKHTVDASNGAFNMFSILDRHSVEDTFVQYALLPENIVLQCYKLPCTTFAETTDGVVQQNKHTAPSLCIC